MITGKHNSMICGSKGTMREKREHAYEGNNHEL